MGQLENGTGVNCNPLYFLEDNNINAHLQKGGQRIWLVQFTSEDKSCTNYSINVFNVDNSTLYNEGNALRIIVINVIERTFDNDYNHILHGI